MLPPKQSQKRTVAVNVRFTGYEYERLKRIAESREMSVTTLVHYVVGHYLLPRMEREMTKEQEQPPVLPPSGSDTSALSWLEDGADSAEP